MHPCSLANLDSKDFILLPLLVLRACLHLCTDFTDLVGSANRESLLNVFHGEEFFNSRDRATSGNKFVKLGKIVELVHWLFALTDFVHVLEDQSSSLLSHDRISAFKSREWRNVGPPVTETGGEEEAGTAAGLSHLIESIVAHLGSK